MTDYRLEHSMPVSPTVLLSAAPEMTRNFTQSVVMSELKMKTLPCEPCLPLPREAVHPELDREVWDILGYS